MIYSNKKVVKNKQGNFELTTSKCKVLVTQFSGVTNMCHKLKLKGRNGKKHIEKQMNHY